jgi:hypothetical protein
MSSVRGQNPQEPKGSLSLPIWFILKIVMENLLQLIKIRSMGKSAGRM